MLLMKKNNCKFRTLKNINMKLFLVFLLQLFLLSSIFAQSYNTLSFIGDDDYVILDALSSPMSVATDFTVEFWMKADLNDNNAQPRVGLFSVNPDVGDNKFLITMGGNTAQDGQIVIIDDPTGVDITSTQIVGDNICHHIAYVRTGTSGELFIDGVSAGTHTVDYILANTDRYSIGQDWDAATPSDFYNGEIDELRVWTVARSQTQIQATMNVELTGTETGLLAYYDFNQGIPAGNNSTETILLDRTSNGLDGQLNNFALNGSFSNWVEFKCDVNAPLPLSISYFNGICKNQQVILNWQTVSEQDNQVFYIEQKLLNEWSVVEVIEGKGTSENITNYTFTDNSKTNEALYYRLKQLNWGRSFEYTDIAIVECADASTPFFTIYPNPSNGQITIMLDQEINVPIHVFDLLGRKVFEQYISQQKYVELNMDVKTGIYFLKIKDSLIKVVIR